MPTFDNRCLLSMAAAILAGSFFLSAGLVHASDRTVEQAVFELLLQLKPKKAAVVFVEPVSGEGQDANVASLIRDFLNDKHGLRKQYEPLGTLASTLAKAKEGAFKLEVEVYKAGKFGAIDATLVHPDMRRENLRAVQFDASTQYFPPPPAEDRPPITGSVLRGASGRYGLEILLVQKDKDGTLHYKPLPVRNVPIGGGFVPRVEVPDGADFGVRVYNDRGVSDVGCELLLDGVNSLHFSQDFRSYRAWMIRQGSTGNINGWHNVGDKGYSFRMKRFGDQTDAAQLVARASEKRYKGWIWANFFRAGVATRSEIKGIGVGERVYMPVKATPGHIDFSRTLETLAIQYEAIAP
jgi:hypothetical protein